MSPSLKAGDIVVVYQTYLYHIGDVITFKTNTQRFVTHRVVRTTRGTFITKGDRNSALDTYSTHISDIIGKVMFHIPTSYFFLFFQA